MKRELRANLLKQRNLLTDDYVAAASETIRERLFGLAAFKDARTVMLYVSMGSEVCTDKIIKESLSMGKRVAIPMLDQQFGKMEASQIKDVDTELTLGKYNTRVPKPEYYRPIDPGKLDFILVPAIAYDVLGNRMGYGGGYYDRYLKRVGAGTVVAGVAFSGQVVEQLPAGIHDVPVQLVIHELGIIHTGR